MMPVETAYRRLLRWYPASWRAENGDIVLGTLLDDAEATGRTRVSPGEAWSLRTSGLGVRLGGRSVAVSTGLALVAAVAAQALMIIGGPVAAFGSNALSLLLSVFLAPTLLTAAAIGMLRRAQRIAPLRAVAVLVLGILAWALAFLTAWSWSVGFDEADAGVALSPLAAGFTALFFLAWCVGSIALLVLVLTLAERVPRGQRWTVAVCAAAFAPPALGLAVISPTLTVLIAATAVVVGAARNGGFSRRERTHEQSSRVSRSARRAAVAPASVAALVALLGIAIAVTGEHWIAWADGTRAMQLGLGIGAFSAIALVIAGVIVFVSRYPRRRLSIVLGAIAVSVGAGVHGVSTVTGASGGGDLPWAALVPLVAGIGILVAGALRTGLPARILACVAVGAGLLFPIWGVLMLAAFLVPIAAIALLIWALRRPRERAIMQVALP